MTYEEVKRIRQNPTAECCDIKELGIMIDVAIEKQIPKKPYKNRFEYYCPCCEEHTVVGKNHYDGHKTRNDYCFNCGQAIDWSEEE